MEDNYHICHLCIFKTKNINQFKAHIKVHSSGKYFWCDKCAYKTVRLASLKNHNFTHSGEKPFSCDHCDYSAAIISRLENHVKKIHQEKQLNGNKLSKDKYLVYLKSLSCEFCEFTTICSTILDFHYNKLHKDLTLYQCNHCDYKSISKSSLINHKQLHSEEIQLYCKYCNFKTIYYKYLIKHYNKIHINLQHSQYNFKSMVKQTFGNDINENSSILIRSNAISIEFLKCDYCDFTSNNKVNLLIHLNQHINKKVLQKDCKITQKHLMEELMIENKLQFYQCDSCKFKSFSQYQLHYHLRMHQKNLFICNYKSSSETFLNEDKLMHEKTNYNNHCSSLVSKKSLYDIISNDKLFKCEDCDYKTSLEQNLTIHKNNHSNKNSNQPYLSNKQFHCDRCDFNSFFKHKLIIHTLTHDENPNIYSNFEVFYHENSDINTIVQTTLSLLDRSQKNENSFKPLLKEKSFQCKYCDFKVALKSKLTSHLYVTHKIMIKSKKYHKTKSTVRLSIWCDYCDYKTSSKKKYRVHKRSHSKNNSRSLMKKTFKCNYCKYNTVFKHSLILHNRSHSCKSSLNNESFKCKQCNFEAPLRYKLILHRKIHRQSKGKSSTSRKFESKIKIMK